MISLSEFVSEFLRVSVVVMYSNNPQIGLSVEGQQPTC